MNYQHEFHAGNFADVFKHAVFCRILHYLRDKPAAFRVIDTHAGAGLYDLSNEKATRGGEWQSGIGKLMGAQIPPAVAGLLSPYLDVVRAVNERGQLRTYPGSPALARAWLRPQDRLLACELVPAVAAALSRNMRGDTRIKTLNVDGWTALNAYVPPKERRGVVLVDPPFEQDGDFARLAQSLETAHRKWATGIYLLWYPIKEPAEVLAFSRRLVRSGIAKIFRAEALIGPVEAGILHGTGLVVVNPPWTLETELSRALPALVEMLSGGHGRCKLDWLTGESA